MSSSDIHYILKRCTGWLISDVILGSLIVLSLSSCHLSHQTLPSMIIWQCTSQQLIMFNLWCTVLRQARITGSNNGTKFVVTNQHANQYDMYLRICLIYMIQHQYLIFIVLPLLDEKIFMDTIGVLHRQVILFLFLYFVPFNPLWRFLSNAFPFN